MNVFHTMSAAGRSLRTAFERFVSHFQHADIAIFHEFLPPPYGGGNQFLLALKNEFEKMGFRTQANAITPTTRACLYNSFNFDFERLRCFRRAHCKMVHRVDGPICLYRGWDDGTDRRIWAINNELADATIFQSNYSLNKHLELGLEFKSAVVIPNAADPAIFHPVGRVAFDRSRRIRLISSSWSDNPNKGAPFYKTLEEMLDWSKYEYTFVGKSKIPFRRIKMIQPLPSGELAALLRQHDIYVTASLHDPCSNSVIEALACGLPCLYIDSGGHPELVREAGCAFSSPEEALEGLDGLVKEYEERRAKISTSSLEKVAVRYLQVLGIASAAQAEN